MPRNCPDNDAEERLRSLDFELEKSKREIDAEKRKYQAILDGISALGDGLLLVDEQFQVVYMNQTMVEAFGERVGEVCYQSIGWKNDACLQCQLRHIADSQTIVKHQALTIDDHVYDVSLVPLHGEDGRVTKLEIIRDVTEGKRLEEQLIESERMAAVGQLAAAVAHEIRNPLGTIVMATRELSGESLSDEDRQLLVEVLNKEADRLNNTLSDFLRFAHPRPPKVAPNDPNAMLQNILTILESDRALKRDISIVLCLDETVSLAPFDIDQMEQVIWNMVLNAIQAMEGKGTLTISSRCRDGFLSIAISDTGKGMKREELGRIFDPFYTTKKEGTGLGLSIAHRIIEAHRGTIAVDSTVGKGTSITITLPVEPYVSSTYSAS